MVMKYWLIGIGILGLIVGAYFLAFNSSDDNNLQGKICNQHNLSTYPYKKCTISTDSQGREIINYEVNN